MDSSSSSEDEEEQAPTQLIKRPRTPERNTASKKLHTSQSVCASTRTNYIELRKSGRPFEAYSKQCLERSLALPLDLTSNVSKVTTGNASKLFKPWSAVPARILANIGFIGHGPGEYARILADASKHPDKKGYSERGGDGILERNDNGGLILLQDKDHKHLHTAKLNTFNQTTRDCLKHNMKLGIEYSDVHGILVFPSESRIAAGEKMAMKRDEEHGFYSLALDGFAPRDIHEDDTSSDALHADADCVETDPSHRIAAFVDASNVDMPDSDGGGNSECADIDIAAAARPAEGQDRPFQQLAARRICAKSGFHLVFGPPGVGKTCILAQATGTLVLPEKRQMRSSANKDLYVKTIALMVAPYVTHARQLYWRMEGVLGANFGENWQKFAVFLACETVKKEKVRRGGKIVKEYVSKDVPSEAEVLHAFKTGTCVFVSTEDSADLLVHVAKAAKAEGCRLLVIKDEAHFASASTAASTKLVDMIESKKGDRAILATATPNADVMRFPLVMWPKKSTDVDPNTAITSAKPRKSVDKSDAADDEADAADDEADAADDEADAADDEADAADDEADGGYEHSFQMTIEEAIQFKYCCDYKLIVPQVFDISSGADVPVKVRDVVKANKMGNAALMTLQAMHAEGKRRCIAYADDSVESAREAVESLRSVCHSAFQSVYGVRCIAHVITHDISMSEREAHLHEFQFGPIETEPNENGNCFPIFRFLVAVRILDQCIDLPSTDTVSILSPPTTAASVLSAHRAIQRLGRALRYKQNYAILCVYIDKENPWLHLLMDVLYKYDPGMKGRLCVRSSNPSNAYEASTIELERAETQAVHDAYDVHVECIEKRSEEYRNEQIQELKRLILLVHANGIDPVTKKLARMPKFKETRLGLGLLWDNMKGRGTRKAELVDAFRGTGFDLDAFFASKKKEREFSKEEQIQELKRLILIVHANGIDPVTKKLARMPKYGETRLALGQLWHNIKGKGQRKAELVDAFRGTGFDLDAFIASQKKEREKEEQIQELKRLILLVHDNEIDPVTKKLARMPKPTEKRLKLGPLWNNMKTKGQRKAELVDAFRGTGFDLDAFFASQTKEREFSKEEQIQELKRLILLVHSNGIDPVTKKLARMPKHTEKRLKLGLLWRDIKTKGTRKADLVDAFRGTGFDLDAFIASQKKK